MLCLRPSTPPELNKIFEDLHHQFPLEELKTDEFYRQLTHDGQFQFYRIIDTGNDNNTLLDVGYIGLSSLANSYLWLDLLGIYPAYQSHGYGRRALAALQQQQNTRGIFLEVEKAQREQAHTLRRIAFYKQCGAHLLTHNYFLPTQEDRLPLDLWLLPAKEHTLTPAQCLPYIQEAWNIIHHDIPHLPLLWKELHECLS